MNKIEKFKKKLHLQIILIVYVLAAFGNPTPEENLYWQLTKQQFVDLL